MVTVRDIQAKSVLNRSKIFDTCLNPYTGCQVGCVYCYARLFVGRYTGHREPWGRFVDVKANAPEVLGRQLQKAAKTTVWISSVCDPYQPIEARRRITRACLEKLAEKQFPVNVQTKSHLVLRDLELLRQFRTIEVGLSITTDDERIARVFEPAASSVGRRLEALAKLRAAGIRTYAFVGPILPGNPERLAHSLQARVDRVLVDRMNYLGSIRRFYQNLGLREATTDAFFRGYAERFASELERRKIRYEILF
ncbi:MAG: radical SAM protein [Desulfobacterales bacterium]|nr:MAG: radical SAM protein [Desulfobacterales bacterium]